MELVSPSAAYLPSYRAALERGYCPDTLRPEATLDELAHIDNDPDSFLADRLDVTGSRAPIILPDGSAVPRLPGIHKWMWDGEFCGAIDLRWQPETTALASRRFGEVGYAVVPWKQGRGYAKRALSLLLPEARGAGLAFIDLITDVANDAAQRSIVANGGQLIATISNSNAADGVASYQFRIYLGEST